MNTKELSAEPSLKSTGNGLRRFKSERAVLEAITYFCRTPKKPRLPTIEQYILAELVNAAVEYSTGKKGEIDYRELNFSLGYRGAYECRAWDYYNKQLSGAEKPCPEIRRAIDDLLEPHFVSPGGPCDPYYNTDLYLCWKGFAGGGICNVVMQSSFSLDEETLRKIKRETLPSLPKQEMRDDCLSIGLLMRKYVQEDLKEIKKNYHW